MRVRRSQVAGLLLLAGGMSCGPGKLAGEPSTPTSGEHSDAPLTCLAAKDPLNPMIVEWPAMNRAHLDAASRRGIVVVSYAGCIMKILADCTAEGSYDFAATTPAGDTLKIEDERKLYAELPLGVATLKGELAQGRSLELGYVAVGQRVANKAPANLSGNCQGATHWVKTMMVGAFTLDTLASNQASAGAGVAGVQSGGADSAKRTRRGSGGDLEGCRTGSAKGESCSSILMLGLTELAPAGGGTTSAGFGAGLAPAVSVPVIQPLQAFSGAASALDGVDTVLLGLLQTAQRADRDKEVAESEKARAWTALADYSGSNSYQSVAKERASAWLQIVAADQARRDQAKKVCVSYTKDKGKLDQLLGMDNETVPEQQKAAYKRELERAYSSWSELIVNGCRDMVEGATGWCAGTETQVCKDRGYKSCQVFARGIPSRRALTGIKAAGCGGSDFSDCVGAEFGRCCCQ